MGANPKAEWLSSHFLDYQLRWIYDDADVALAWKGRQLGFSDGTAGRIICKGHYEKRPQVFLSASQRIADELIATVKTHCEMLAALGNRAATDYAVDNSGELAWRTGGRVLALSSSGRTGRSYHGDIYFDEFAYHENPEKIWAAAAPMATRKGWQLRVISTPNGAQGKFYEWVTSTPEGWSLHKVSLDDAIADGLEVDREKLLSLVGGDDRMFAEAYQLAFLDADLQYVPTALADRAIQYKAVFPGFDAPGIEIHAGLDVGRHHDLTVLTIVAVVHGIAWVLAILTCKRTAFRAQKKMVSDARELFGWSTLHVDKTGLGEQFAEELVEKWGDEEVKLVAFTNETKADLATRMLRWLRDGRVRYPRGDEGTALYAETIAVRRKVTPNSNVVYTVPRTAKGHGDRWWSACLALKGAGEPPIVRGMGQEPLLSVA